MIKHIIRQEVFNKQQGRVCGILEVELPFLLREGMEIEQSYYKYPGGEVVHSTVSIDESEFKCVYIIMKPIEKQKLDRELEISTFEGHGWKVENK